MEEEKEMIKVFNPMVVRERIIHHLGKYEAGLIELSLVPSQHGATIGRFNKAIKKFTEGELTKKDENQWRRFIFGWLFGDPNKSLYQMSTKKFQEAHWHSIGKWLACDPDMGWAPRGAWIFEIAQIYYQVQRYSQDLTLAEEIARHNPAWLPRYINISPNEISALAIILGASPRVVENVSTG